MNEVQSLVTDVVFAAVTLGYLMIKAAIAWELFTMLSIVNECLRRKHYKPRTSLCRRAWAMFKRG